MADGGNALGSMQRLVEERSQQAATAQQTLMHLQQDHARLTANLRTAQDQAASRSVSPKAIISAALVHACILVYPGCSVPWKIQTVTAVHNISTVYKAM